MLRHFSSILLSGLLLVAIAHGSDGQQRGIKVSSAPAELLSESALRYFSSVLDVDESLQWYLYLPENYDPNAPAGLMVYVSPTHSGVIPPAWKGVLNDKNMIWIAASQSGNKVDPALRVSYAVLATVLAKRDYSIDKKRVYVSGFSGGGRVASVVAPGYASLFMGAIYFCGVNFWGDQIPTQMDQVRSNRYVFVTGKQDFNRQETRNHFRAYKKAGVKGVKLMDIPGMGHSTPDAADFSAAVDFLDGPE